MAGSKESTPTPPQRFMAFSQRMSTFSQGMSTELNVVGLDHCYAKPWSSHPDASNARPLQLLFMDKYSRQPALERQRSDDALIDVDGEEPAPPAPYDVSKARAMMSDCDRHSSLLRPDFSESKEDWEDHFAAVRTTWTVQQNRIFAKVMKVLQADRLARLSIVDTKNEPIQRRLQIDKAAKRIRFAFGNIGWDKTLTLWLHNLLLDKLRGQLLTSYLEVMQKLKSKIPSLIDRLIEGTLSKQGTLASESLGGLLKRNWDPVMPSINQQKLKKLPDNPLLLVIPGAPISGANPTSGKRHKFWTGQLSAMGKVVSVVPINTNTNMSIANCVENMVATTRSKILEMKGHFPGRLVVLIGWNVGALVALHVSLVEVVHAVVCLGFPTMGITGNRGEVDDAIYNCKTPTLFVVGQFASATDLDCLEDIRERLRMETGLLLVGGADDQLRMTRAKKRSCGLTQAMVDRCIMEEMGEFVGSALSQVIIQPENREEVDVVRKQQKKRRQRDMSSAAGSQTLGSGIVKPPKKIRTMKMTNVGTGAFSGHLVAGAGALDKKAPAKKRLGKLPPGLAAGARTGAGQKPMLHLTLPVIASTSTRGEPLGGSKPSLSEAAAIASAPELSTLLQSIKTTTEQAMVATASAAKPSPASFISSKISSSAATSLLAPSSSAPSSTVPTTTALTLSKFLASSGLLGRASLGKADLTSDSATSAVDSQPGGDAASDDLDLEELSGKEDSPVKNPPPSPRQQQPQQQHQQPQILIRARPSSSPFSIPLTFSMASKVLKSSGGAMMKLGQGSGTQQIQQLLTSTASEKRGGGATLSASQATQASCDVPDVPLSQATSSEVGNTSTSAVGTSVGHVTHPISSPVKSSKMNTSATSPHVSDLPRASVINMGSDTVYLKETPPSTASAPGTVSVDLGQIASGNTGSAIKLQASSSSSTSSSKISLIPSMRHMPLSISSSSSASSSTSSSLSSSPDRVQLSSPVPLTRSSTLTSLSIQKGMISTTAISSNIKAQPRLTLSSPGIQLLTTSTTTTTVTASGQSRIGVSQTPTILQASPHLGLSALASSQILSTLSTTAGVIRFKVATTLPSHSHLPNVVDQKKPSSASSQGTDETDGHSGISEQSADPFLKSSQLPAFIDLTEDNSPTASPSKLQPAATQAKTVTAFAGSQTLSLLSMKTSGGKNPLANRIITSPVSASRKLTLTQGMVHCLSGVSSPIVTSVGLPPKVTSETGVTTIPAESSSHIAAPLPTSSSVSMESSTATLNKNLSPSPVRKPQTQTVSSTSVMHSPSSVPPSPPTPASPNSQSAGAKASKSQSISSYTATPKPVLSTVASTRTRRVKAPKQFDL